MPEEYEASPLIISETETHITIAIEMSKAMLRRHWRFLELLTDVARGREGEPRD